MCEIDLDRAKQNRKRIIEAIGDDMLGRFRVQTDNETVSLAIWMDEEADQKVQIRYNEKYLYGYRVWQDGVKEQSTLDDCVNYVKKEYPFTKNCSAENKRAHLLDKVGDDELSGVDKDDDVIRLAKWHPDSADEAIKVEKDLESGVPKLVPRQETILIRSVDKIASIIRKQYPSLRSESLDERYEDADGILTNWNGQKVYFKTPLIGRDGLPDIKLRSSRNSSTVIELYQFSDLAVRCDIEHGYVQYTEIYEYDKIPLEAVIDRLRLTEYDVERNQTSYRIEDCADTVGGDDQVV